MTARIPKILLSFLCSTLVACSATSRPPGPDDYQAALRDQRLPLRAALVFDSVAGDKALVGLQVVDVGQAKEELARKVFGAFLSEVGLRGEVEDPHLTIRVRWKGSYATSRSTRRAKLDELTADVRLGTGEPVGVFSADEEARGSFRDEDGMRSVFEHAYLDVARQLVAAPVAAEAARNPRLALSGMPKARLPESRSEFEAIEKAVVSIQADIDWGGDRELTSLAKELTHNEGSGFLIGHGVVLTSYHVVESRPDLTVTTHDGQKYPAKLAVSDEWLDLAVLVIDEARTPWVPLHTSFGAYSVGDRVAVVGAPYGSSLRNSVSQGVISSIRMMDGNPVIQTDAATNPGNSGGPLVHAETGEVIGIVAFRQSEGVGFAYALPHIEDFLRRNRQFLNSDVGREAARLTPDQHS